LVDTLQYCPLYAVTIPCYAHVELSVYGVMAAISGADSTLSATSAQEVQSSIAPYVRHFFDADLNDSDSSHNWLNNIAWDGKGLVLGRGPERRAPPTPEQFQRIIQTYGTDRASQLVSQFNLVNPADPIMPDATFTQLGYQFLQRGDVASSLVVFRWGVTAYPQSANAWDSFGEATAANGDIDSALAYYRKAQEALPNDTLAGAQMHGILETSIPTNIARLEQMIAERARAADSTQSGN
jgi:tetratricopeptide (TPR) repeat protein